MSSEETDPARRTKPDGSAWKNAQREMAERNDAARKRGSQERSSRERDAAVRLHLRNRDKGIEL